MILCNFQGEIITPDNISYNDDRQIWNRAIQRYPAIIAYCENVYDVSWAVQYSKENNIPIRIRSGGHNYEGYCIGDNVIVIDVSKINSIKINHILETVTIGGGVTNKQLYDTVSIHGYPFPGGTCPTVGVSGFCLGGGWGLSARKFGLGCDSLLEVQLVDYNGQIIVANEHCNPELFWALRGAGGGNFGVVVSMTFRLPPKTDDVTYFELYYPNADQDTQVAFLEIFQRWIVSVSNDINVVGGIYNTAKDDIYIFIRGICYGSPERTKDLLEPFYFTDIIEDTFNYGSFLEIINIVGSSYPPSEKFKSTGRFVCQYYSKNELYKLTNIINCERPKGSILTSLSIYGLGGRVRNVSPHDTAFYYRNANFILSIQSVWEKERFACVNRRWVLNHFPIIYNVTEGSFINFPLLQLPDYTKSYFGINEYKLYYIKKVYDPYNVFSFPQSIPNTSCLNY